MPRVKQIVSQEQTPEKAIEVVAPKEETFEVKVKRVAVRTGPDIQSNVILVLHQGERVCGVHCKVDGLPWLRVQKEIMKSHPLSSVIEEEFAWVLIDASDTDLGLGLLLERAPAELGWCASDKEQRSEVYEVVGKGGVNVTQEKDLMSMHEVELLGDGSLVKALEVDYEDGRLHYSLLAGSGPEEGWVTLDRVTRVSHRRALAPVSDDNADIPVDEARVREAMRWYGEACCKKASGSFAFSRVAFSWAAPSAKAEEAAAEAAAKAAALRGELERALAPAQEAAEEAQPAPDEGPAKMDAATCEALGKCGMCGLPLGDNSYDHKTGPVHAECFAQGLILELKEEEDERIRNERLRKNKRHAEYGIGWSPSKIPLNAPAVRRLTGEEVPNGMLALALTPDGEIALVPTACPGAAVNLEYLSIALRVRIEEGREPVFSLDPVDPKLKSTMQIKRFEPHWLKGTSVGHVLFESDYHLKELSLGEYDQPVVGMRSCFDNSDEEDVDAEWSAREWYVVRKAEVQMSEDGVLIPWVKMGVEAREQIVNEQGQLEDQRCTRPDHPLVKYAEDFTKNFDLIAERKSVVFHLRELAKASILAKYLDQSKANLDGLMDIFESAEDEQCILEVPQIWNERNKSRIHLHDGEIVNEDKENDGSHCVYGGAQFGLHRFRLAPSMASGAIQARRGFIPPRMGFQARRGFMAPFGGARGFAPARGFTPARGLVVPSSALTAKRGFVGPAAAISARPGFFVSPSRLSMPTMSVTPSLRGVDLGLDKFELTNTAVAAREGPLALSEELADCVCIGKAFWQEFEAGKESVLPEEEKRFMEELFHPGLSDRRAEGNLFVPPDTSGAYADALKSLLRKEREVRQKRKTLFFSTDFVEGSSCNLFPSSWNTSFEVARRDAPKKMPPPQAGLQARDLEERLPEIRQALKACTPAFERSTEDGAVFRIYHLGSLEVRTSQDLGAEEEVGAVFSARGEVAEEPKPPVESGDKLEKVTQYAEGSQQEQRFFVVMETEKGSILVSEKLTDGSVTLIENPKGLDDRISLAKVIRAAGGLAEKKDASTVHSMKIYQGSRTRTDVSQEARQRYADGAFNRAAKRVPSQIEVEPFESFAAKHYPRLHQLLGLGKTEAKTEEAVLVA